MYPIRYIHITYHFNHWYKILIYLDLKCRSKTIIKTLIYPQTLSFTLYVYKVMYLYIHTHYTYTRLSISLCLYLNSIYNISFLFLRHRFTNSNPSNPVYVSWLIVGPSFFFLYDIVPFTINYDSIDFILK